MNNFKQKFDIVIQPEMENELSEALKKDTEKLEWMIDNPYTGIKPVGQTGLLEHIGKALWKASGLDPGKVLDMIEH